MELEQRVFSGTWSLHCEKRLQKEQTVSDHKLQWPESILSTYGQHRDISCEITKLFDHLGQRGARNFIGVLAPALSWLTQSCDVMHFEVLPTTKLCNSLPASHCSSQLACQLELMIARKLVLKGAQQSSTSR